MARLRELLTRRATLRLVSHSLEAVLDVCQWVVLLRDGRVVAPGPAAELVRACVDHAVPGQPQTAAG